jgi:hypothetical protein
MMDWPLEEQHRDLKLACDQTRTIEGVKRLYLTARSQYMGPNGYALQPPCSRPNLTTALEDARNTNRSEGMMPAAEPLKRADPRSPIEHWIY